MSNDILIIATVDAVVTKDEKDNISSYLKKSLDEGVIVKDESITNLYVIDKAKKEMITLVY